MFPPAHRLTRAGQAYLPVYRPLLADVRLNQGNYVEDPDTEWTEPEPARRTRAPHLRACNARAGRGTVQDGWQTPRPRSGLQAVQSRRSTRRLDSRGAEDRGGHCL